MKPAKISPVPYVILGVSLGLLGFFILLANPFGWKMSFPSFTKKPSLENVNPQAGKKLPEGLIEAPTPYLILPHGKQTYNVQSGNNRVSMITTVIYDPLDPKIDSTQTISVTAKSKESINLISLTVNTDNQTKVYPLTFSSGTKLNGVWTASFIASDTYEKIYDVSFEIITELGNRSIQPMPLR